MHRKRAQNASKMAQRTQIATKMVQNRPKLELRGRPGAPKWPMTAPGGPAPVTAPPKWSQVTSQRGQEGSKRHPWTHQRPPRGVLRTPGGAQETPKGAQEGAKMAQEGSKGGLESDKCESENVKKPWVFYVFLASWALRDDAKGLT